jgi:hypothetical protein
MFSFSDGQVRGQERRFLLPRLPSLLKGLQDAHMCKEIGVFKEENNVRASIGL